MIERTIRVDQAGEFGAVRIYQGQLAALRWTGRANGEAGRKIAVMARAEREHNKVFDRLLAERRSGPPCCRRCGTWPASRWARRRR